MDAAVLRQLAVNASSDDIAVSRDAARQLQKLLTLSQVVSLLQASDTAQALAALLGEVEAAQNHDLYRLVGGVLERVYAGPSGADAAVLFASPARFLLDFVVRSAASTETSIAASVLAALRHVLTDLEANSEAAAYVGHRLDEHFRNEHVLRLLNCDQPDDPANAVVCAFLGEHTTLVSFLLETTEGAFADDPLLLANYLTGSGVVCRSSEVPPGLRQISLEVLQSRGDALYFAFVCRFWSIAFFHHEDNGTRDAAMCVSAVAPAIEASTRDEEVTEATFDLLGSAASTKSGWDAVTGVLTDAALQTRLRSTSSSLRLSALNLTLALLNSPHVVPSYLTKDLLLDAWQTRTTPDDEVRLSLWRLVLKALQFEELKTILAAVCASFLCSGAYEENITVRTMKLQAADYLIHHATLPESVAARLKEFVDRGLYPTGSSGVSLMTKD